MIGGETSHYERYVSPHNDLQMSFSVYLFHLCGDAKHEQSGP